MTNFMKYGLFRSFNSDNNNRDYISVQATCKVRYIFVLLTKESQSPSQDVSQSLNSVLSLLQKSKYSYFSLCDEPISY